MSRRLLRGIVLALIVVVGGLLRLEGLGARELSMDEAYSWRMIGFPLGAMLRRLGGDVHPPLYYLVLKAWASLFGDSLVALRGVSALFGILTVLAVGRLADHIVGDESGDAAESPTWTGLLAAGLVAVSPFQVAYSRTARMYALGTFLAALSSWALLRALRCRPRSLPRWALYVVAAAACLYTHYYACFVIAAQALLVVLACAAERRRTGPNRPDTLVPLAAPVAAFLLYAPWVPFQAGQMRDVWTNYWIPPLTSHTLRALIFRFVTGLTDQIPIGDQIAWLTAAVVLAALVYGWRQDRLFLAAQVLGPWAGGVILATLGQKTVMIERYLIFAHLFYLVALAVALRLTAVPLRIVMASLLLGECALGLSEGREADRPWEPKGNLERLVRRLGAGDAVRGRIIVVPGAGEANLLRYHASRAGHALPLRILNQATSYRGHWVYATSASPEEWIALAELTRDERSPLVVVQREQVMINQFLHRPARGLEIFAQTNEERWHMIYY